MKKGIATYIRDGLFKGWSPGVTAAGFPMIGTTSTGEVFRTGNYESQLKVNRGIVYSCVDIRGLGVAKTPLRVYIAKTGREKSNFRFIKTKEVSKKRKEKMFAKAIPGSRLSMAGDVEEVVDGKFVQLLRHVNDFQSISGLKKLTPNSLDLTGDTYWYLIRTKPPVSRPIAIWIIPSGYIKPIPDKIAFVKGYRYKRGPIEINYEKDDIVHFKMDSLLSQYIGEAPLNAAGDSVNLRRHMLNFETDMFKTGGNAKAIITTKNKNTTEEQTKRFMATVNQTKQAGHLIIGGDDFDITYPPHLTARDMGYQTGLKMTMEDIAQVFHIPMAVLTSDNVNKANAEIGKILVAEYAITPLTTIIDETITEQLAWQFDDRYFVLFDDPVPENRVAILAEWKSMFEMGVMTQNDIRIEDGKEPFEGGDIHYRQGTLVPIGEEMEEMAEEIALEAWSKAKARYNFGRRREAI